MKKIIFSAASLVLLSFVSGSDAFTCQSNDECKQNNLGSICFEGGCVADNLTTDFDSKINKHTHNDGHGLLEQSFTKCKVQAECPRVKKCMGGFCKQQTIEELVLQSQNAESSLFHSQFKLQGACIPSLACKAPSDCKKRG